MTEEVDFVEIAVANKRVGETPAGRLRWGLNFLQMNLLDLTEGDWANLRRELFAFDHGQIPYESKDPRSRKVLRLLKSDSPAPTSRRAHLPPKEEVQQVQAQFRRVVEELLESKTVDVGPITTTLSIFCIPEEGVSYFVRAPDLEKAPRGLWTLAHLLGAFAAFVRKCPEPKCGRWFLAGRKTQWYCSTRCQTRATTRAYREAQKKRSGTRQRKERRQDRRSRIRP